MTREELAAVRDVIDALLRCPDHVRELLTQWIAPEARSKERTVPLISRRPTAAISFASGRVDGKSVRRN
jgi:hypothetical protein